MKLISCESCGVVLDADRIECPVVYDEDGVVIVENAAWDYDEYEAVIKCPCCFSRIFYNSGDLIWS